MVGPGPDRTPRPRLRRRLGTRAARLGGPPAAPDRDAFADYVSVLTDWRRLPYWTGAPAELLPASWAGARAAETFFTFQSRLAGAAREHVAGATGAQEA